MDYFSIDIDGRQFRKSYLIYVVEIIHKNKGQFFYIGQTGDRNYLTARPAFRRLGGHFSDQGHSTENQVYRQIAVKVLELKGAEKRATFSPTIKKAVSDFLVNSKTKMHVFPIRNFTDEITENQHKENREFVESIEKRVIHKIIDKFGENRILNKKILHSGNLDNKTTKELTDEIIKKICRQSTSYE